MLKLIPNAETVKAEKYCRNLNINDFSRNYKAELANKLGVDPASIRIYGVQYVPQFSGGSCTWFLVGGCDVSFAHPKGVYTDSFAFPKDMDFRINVPLPPVQPVQPLGRDDDKDYRNECPGHTPLNMRRNKQCHLIY